MANVTAAPKWTVEPFKLIQTPKFERGSLASRSTDDYLETASTMAVVHNCIIRGLNTIYLQAPHIQSEDYKNFIGYCLCWLEVLDGHHDREEENLFPSIEESSGVKGLMGWQLQPGVARYKAYLQSLSGKDHSFSGETLCSIIDSFGSILHQHLADEIPTLLDLSSYGSKIPLAQLWEKEGRGSMAAMSKTRGLPFFFMNMDVTFEDRLWKDWPGAPGPVKWAIRNIFTGWNAGYWKFAACNFKGIPKPL